MSRDIEIVSDREPLMELKARMQLERASSEELVAQLFELARTGPFEITITCDRDGRPLRWDENPLKCLKDGEQLVQIMIEPE